MLEKQFDSMMAYEEMRIIIVWGLSQKSPLLMELNNDREVLAETFFNTIVGEHFKGKDKDIRAVMPILISSIYYTTLISQMNGSTICRIDLQKPKDRKAIKKTFKQIIEWAYS